ncbi:YcjX family protein [Geminicoccaceae bacterium 1502E]|nr:YcjX family protein [Geminicoccaceae bacterium 1502E]
MVIGRLGRGIGRFATELVTDAGQVADRALDRHLRLAVTGLRRSGKTVFITSLVHHLLDGGGLPFLQAVHDERYLGARLLPPGDGEAFPYEPFHAALSGPEPFWPEATERLSRLRLELRFRTANRVLRNIQPIQRLEVEIIDYPGEWLLDLPLLEASFESFSDDALRHAARDPRAGLARPWLERVTALDQAAPADRELLAGLAAEYRRYLRRCQDELGMSLVQPGRFTNPGELEGSELLEFCPLPPGEGPPGSLRDLAVRRFDRYRRKVVRRFYEEHFSRFDRQVVLVDLLASLNLGPAHFADTQEALGLILQSFRYGSGGILQRLFAPRIDRLLFAASKADHVAPSQHPALKQLLERLVAPAAHGARLEGVLPEVMALASLRSTDVVRTEHHGQALSCVRGRLKDEPRETVLFPGEVPPDPPGPEEWRADRFRFKAFAPRRLRRAQAAQHIRLDQALEFLLGDKLR